VTIIVLGGRSRGAAGVRRDTSRLRYTVDWLQLRIDFDSTTRLQYDCAATIR